MTMMTIINKKEDIMILNGYTKKGQKFFKNYRDSSTFDIFDAYNRPSWQKLRAYKNIEDDMAADNGWRIKNHRLELKFFFSSI